MNTYKQTDNQIPDQSTLSEGLGGLFSKYKIENFKVRPRAKNAERLRLVERLSEILGRNKRGVHFITMIWTESMLEDSIRSCQHFQAVKARNYHFNEYVKQTKVNGKD